MVDFPLSCSFSGGAILSVMIAILGKGGEPKTHDHRIYFSYPVVPKKINTGTNSGKPPKWMVYSGKSY